MSISCKVFGHKWEHCKCARCGAKRNSDHVWDGCICTVCGWVRNTEHTYELEPDSYKYKGAYGTGYILLDHHTFHCVKCEGKTLPRAVKSEPHIWTGRGCVTKCSVCGAMPAWFTDKEHFTLYNTKVKQEFDLSHQWTGRTCRDTCKACGKKYADLYGGHEWSGDSCKAVCKLCGMKKPGGKHRWTGNTCVDRCKLCGEKNPEGKHQWTGDTCVDYCTLCGAKYPDHKYEMVASRTTSYGTKIGTYRCAGCGREYEQPYEWSSSDSV